MAGKNISIWYVYILKCSDGSYYVGHTNDLVGRVKKHNKGKATRWTSSRLPVTLAYSEKYEHKDDAINREHQIKKWSRKKKDALIAGDLMSLKQLSSVKH